MGSTLGAQPSGLSRRTFLKRSAGVAAAASLGGLIPAVGARAQGGASLEGPVNWLVSTPALVEPEAIAPFTEATGVAIEAVPYSTYDEMLAKVRGAQTPFDIISMEQSHVKLLAEEGHILPIPTSEMANFDSVFPVFRDRDTLNFEGQTWAAPAFFGANALAYNRAMLPEVDSVGALFDPANSGLIGMRDEPEDAFLVGALQAGFTPYEMDDAQLQEVKNLLIEQKPLVRVYWRGIADLEAAFANEELAVAWSQLLLIEPLRAAGLDMGWTWPKEGVAAFLAVVALADTATHVPAANAFLDYLMGPEWGLAIASKYGYAPTSEAAFDAFTPEIAEKVAIDPTRIENVRFRQPFDREKYTALWEEVKAA
jgi:spermidine/putrescine-binding protein